jgi:hypothetical protein
MLAAFQQLIGQNYMFSMPAAAVMTAQSNKMHLSEKLAGGPRGKANCSQYRQLIHLSSIAACIVMLVLDVQVLS